MFRLISIQQIVYGNELNPEKHPYRCVILADNTTDALPSDGGGVVGMNSGQKILPGSIAVTPALDVSVMGNDGEWGGWN